MKTLWWFLAIILGIFSFVAGLITLISTWIGSYKPCIDGPDPLLLLLTAIVFIRVIAKDFE